MVLIFGAEGVKSAGGGAEEGSCPGDGDTAERLDLFLPWSPALALISTSTVRAHRATC